MSERLDLTAILQVLDRKEPGAEDRRFDLVYGELRELARAAMRTRDPEESLQLTSIVHEAYLRLSGGQPSHWQNRRHFFGSALRAMRQILVERARRRKTLRHGGAVRRIELDENVASDPARSVDYLALDAAFEKLAALDARKSQVIQYRFVLGMTVPQTAELLGVSTRTVENDSVLARAWLNRELSQP